MVVYRRSAYKGHIVNVHKCEQNNTSSYHMLLIVNIYVDNTDKTINGHMILLQLGSVRPHWRSFGSAAGVDEETLDMVRHHPPDKVSQC